MSEVNKAVIENPLDELLGHIAVAIEKWKAENTPEKIEAVINRKLDGHADTIILKLLGFDNKWASGTWELDHCNGRAGNSSAGDFIKEHSGEAIKRWLETVAMPSPSPKVTEQLKKSCRDAYQRAFEQRLGESIRMKAQRDADALLAKVTDPTQFDNYLKTLALLEAKPESN
jgi:hypothetical protein